MSVAQNFKSLRIRIKKNKDTFKQKTDKHRIILKKVIKVNKNTGPFYKIQDAINIALPNSIIKVFFNKRLAKGYTWKIW
jgi:hypothetical protein